MVDQEEVEESEFRWRMWIAVSLTLLGSIYYLIFLAYFSKGVPIEKIQNLMLDGFPDFWYTYIPLISPVFLIGGLVFWYIHVVLIKRGKALASPHEPEYKFEFNTFNKSEEAPHPPDVDYVFKSRQNTDDPD